MIRKENHIFIRVVAFPGEEAIIRFLCTALLCCIGAYAYFVSLSIMNVIAAREATLASERLRSEVSLLEEEYFKLVRGITPESAGHLGMSPLSHISFVREIGAVGAVTMSPDAL